MSKTVFKKPLPNKAFLFDLLDDISLKGDTCYVFDFNAYRKLLFHNFHITFLDKLRPYYYLSKQFYTTREMTYKNFSTVLRHICRHLDIKYETQMHYSHSEYNINYYIYF
jgi:hypothetical protein